VRRETPYSKRPVKPRVASVLLRSARRSWISRRQIAPVFAPIFTGSGGPTVPGLDRFSGRREPLRRAMDRPALRDGHACRNVPSSQLPAVPWRLGPPSIEALAVPLSIARPTVDELQEASEKTIEAVPCAGGELARAVSRNGQCVGPPRASTG